MRLYHKYFRVKNPEKKPAPLRGTKKELHAKIVRSLGAKKNPEIKKTGLGKAIDAYNLLGKLNKQIDEGRADLIPLRDTVRAKIEGYLSGDALSYSVADALRNLSREEVRVIKEMLAEAGPDISPEQGRAIRERARKHPAVRRARRAVEVAEKAEQEFKKATARSRRMAAEDTPRLSAKELRLGKPYRIDSGFFGLISSTKNSKFQWDLIDKDGEVYLRGFSTTKSGASREVGLAHRTVNGLITLGSEAGWDNLSDKDRRWLEDKKPQLSKRVARILLQHINERRRVSKSTAQWIVSAADIGKFKPEGKDDMAQTCKNMTIGEERIFPGPKKAYRIHVKKGMGGKFSFFVETQDGKTSQTWPEKNCSRILQKGHMVGGAMSGATEVSRALQNPAKLKKLENSARRFFRKQNPDKDLPRQEAEVGDIREFSGMFRVPDNPDDAYRYGFYMGIIKGIDTCGVHKYFKRRKIRQEFKERLLQAAVETTARVTGTSTRRKRRKAADEADDIYSSVIDGIPFDED